MQVKEGNILFLGDCYFGGVLEYESYDIQLGRLKHESTHIVGNVEQALQVSEQEDKCTVISSAKALSKGLDISGITHAGIANNHIHDSGLENISVLKEHIEDSNVVCFGAGNNIEDASLPVDIGGGLFAIGCCAFDKPTLNNIAIVGDRPGVFPADKVSLSKIIGNNKDKKLIIYAHWGEEHIPIPHPYTRDLAKWLLSFENVVAIIGMHPHIILPMERFYGKPVYYSLGNFLFPNFVIEPPTKVSFKPNYTDVTYSYHKVNKFTLKKWNKKNRLSLVLDYDCKLQTFTEHIALQSDDSKLVRLASTFEGFLSKLSCTLLSSLLSQISNDQLYKILYRVVRTWVISKRWLYIAYKLFRQFGINHIWKIVKKIILRH